MAGKITNIGRRLSHSEGVPYAWKSQIQRGEIKFNKPTVLFFPGAGIINDKKANREIKNIIKALGRIGVKEQDINLFSINYADEYSHKITLDAMKYFQTGNESIDKKNNNLLFFKDIYETIFKPIITNSKGGKKSIEDIKKSFRNITIISHCFGSVSAFFIIKNIKEDMARLGFNDNEIKDVLSELVNISISPRTGFENCDSSVLSIGFLTFDDYLKKFPIVNMEDFGVKNIDKKSFYYSDIGNALIPKNINPNFHLYVNGKMYDYEKFDIPNLGDGALNANFVHHLSDYIDEDKVGMSFSTQNGEETCVQIDKNSSGKNFSRLICKVMQNSVSLSMKGEKRNLDNVVSNETPITFKQGKPIENIYTTNLHFDGDNEVFRKNYDDFKAKLNLDKQFEDATQKIEPKENNITINLNYRD
ncbi:hypothetical protein HDR60_03900 [bacterium]|nr:hypothetical protein [bacterium]